MIAETLKRVIVAYATEKDDTFHRFLDSLSSKELRDAFLDLLNLYSNDKNSSKIRELVTLWISGFEPSPAKLGYNGFRIGRGVVKCEVKPKNTESTKKKLRGEGSFNDYTYERLEKDIKENPTVLVSGFVLGKLLYIMSFEFRCLESHLKSLLDKRFRGKPRQAGEYLRSAQFSFKDYVNCQSLRIVYLRDNWQAFKEYISKDLVKFFESHE
ncbi:hypothetical protein HRbin13_00267 [bacterium HR13]|nr:hypothetical protein HRbin13_00267 [bacterium HR13]